MTQADAPTPEILPAARHFRWRRLFQYRLRTLLILTAIIAAWLGWWTHTVRRQRDAVAALWSADAIVRYDFEESDLERPPHWPEWMIDTMGVDYFANVYSVEIHTTVTDGDLQHLQDLTGLRSLNLIDTNITDSSLKHLQGLTALQHLDLSGTKITDAGLDHLQCLTALQDLDISGTRITDAGLSHLQNLAALQDLDVSETQITDAGLEYLQHLTDLKGLNILFTRITDAGALRLKQSLPHCHFAVVVNL